MTTLRSKGIEYINKATQGLQKIDLPLQEPEVHPIDTLIERIRRFGEHEADSLALVLKKQGALNEIIHDQIGEMSVPNRHAEITALFAAVRQDASRHLQRLETGEQPGLIDRLRLWFSQTTQKTVPQRFRQIRELFLDSSQDLTDQIERETRILQAYQDFRLALKCVEADAHGLLEKAARQLDASIRSVRATQTQLEDIGEDAVRRRINLEVRHNEKLQEYHELQADYQVAKDLADQIRTAYGTSEVIFARISQTLKIKQRLREKAITFFSTTDIVLAGLATIYTQQQGLSNGAQSINAIASGISHALDDQARNGQEHLQEGIRTGYGANIEVDAMRSFIGSIEAFESESASLIQQISQEMSDVSLKIHQETEQSQQRFAEQVRQPPR